MTERIFEVIPLLALEVYLQDRQNDKTSNVCMSPMTLLPVLMMIQAGSENKSIMNVLTLTSLREKDLHPSVGMVLQALTNGDAASIHCALFRSKDGTIYNDYQSLIYDCYGARVIGDLDFEHDPATCIRTINDWISHHTHGKISNMLPAVDPLTKIMLVSAFYFKSDWKQSFEPTFSYVDDFHLENTSSSSSTTVQTKYMHRKDFFQYTSNEYCQVLELAYTDESYSMLFLLPHKNLSVLEKVLTSDFIDRICDQLHLAEVDVVLPVYKVEHESDVLGSFCRMGMDLSDLSKMTPDEGVFINSIHQKTVVEVNEQGTVAASALTVLFGGGPRHVPFKANHPFIYVLMERVSRTLLLIGCVQNPCISST